jgi:hypothetical protein
MRRQRVPSVRPGGREIPKSGNLEHPGARGLTHRRSDRLVTPQPSYAVIQICQSVLEPIALQSLPIVEFGFPIGAFFDIRSHS